MKSVKVMPIPKEGRPYDVTYVPEYGMMSATETVKEKNVPLAIRAIQRLFGKKIKIEDIHPVR